MDGLHDLTPLLDWFERSPNQATIEAACTGREGQSNQVGAAQLLDHRLVADKPTNLGDPESMAAQRIDRLIFGSLQ
ncbi:hypothetical protein [Leptolyngbya iicbica]|uniref:Uncharacterized protein n=2 Tax=Cyanophyceae TaxID=3028117 RepID=A0A4Q7EED9_9CYAN|nr:hypothetical protein DYY88_02705 [Leptolyngbya sp. LK]